MRNIKLTISYDGTYFKGWQIQKQGERTVQGAIQDALAQICNHSIKITGSGRTDSGVHALGQVAHFKTKSSIPLSNLQRALNTQLPDDVVITDVEEVSADFHAQHSAKSKVYRYVVLNQPHASALNRHTEWHIPYKINVARMRREAQFLLGKHDFRAFSAVEGARRVKSTVRTLKRIDIKKRQNHLIFELEADGFLYKMVRNIVGTLIEVGCQKGTVPLEGTVPYVLAQKQRQYAGPTAKPQGLFLLKVYY